MVAAAYACLLAGQMFVVWYAIHYSTDLRRKYWQRGVLEGFGAASSNHPRFRHAREYLRRLLEERGSRGVMEEVGSVE